MSCSVKSTTPRRTSPLPPPPEACPELLSLELRPPHAASSNPSATTTAAKRPRRCIWSAPFRSRRAHRPPRGSGGGVAPRLVGKNLVATATAAPRLLAALADGQARRGHGAFEHAEPDVDHDRQQGDQHGTGDQAAGVLQGDGVDDEHSEPARADQ